jgi:hypothetical protein
MKMDDKLNIKVGILPTPVAYGLVVDITGMSGFFQYMDNIAAERKVDVLVRLDGVKKEFTFDEFKERLGF